MQYRKLNIIFIILLFSTLFSVAQLKVSYEEADTKSYDLYLNGKWNELLHYGKFSIHNGQDFIYLRLRIGYAAVMLKNYSEALKHYNHILSKDSYNEIARYYAWFCLMNLNQPEQAYIHVPYFSKDAKASEKISKIAVREAGIESSYKITDVITRDNSLYNKISFSARLGWKTNIEQSFVTYNQTINERALVNIKNNRQINIDQKEYYNRTTISLDQFLQLKLAFHYIETPFNSLNVSPFSNIVYKSNLLLFGLKFHGNYCTFQGAFVTGKLSDTAVHQFNFQTSYFPLGNLNLYGISNFMIRGRNGISSLNFKQIAGCKLSSFLWLEANATFGKFSYFTENDLLYVYNAIDENQFKGGLNVYLKFNRHLSAQTGYTFEKRKLYNTNYLFNQHSINGGITWKF